MKTFTKNLQRLFVVLIMLALGATTCQEAQLDNFEVTVPSPIRVYLNHTNDLTLTITLEDEDTDSTFAITGCQCSPALQVLDKDGNSLPTPYEISVGENTLQLKPTGSDLLNMPLNLTIERARGEKTANKEVTIAVIASFKDEEDKRQASIQAIVKKQSLSRDQVDKTIKDALGNEELIQAAPKGMVEHSQDLIKLLSQVATSMTLSTLNNEEKVELYNLHSSIRNLINNIGSIQDEEKRQEWISGWSTLTWARTTGNVRIAHEVIKATENSLTNEDALARLVTHKAMAENKDLFKDPNAQ